MFEKCMDCEAELGEISRTQKETKMADLISLQNLCRKTSQKYGQKHDGFYPRRQCNEMGYL